MVSKNQPETNRYSVKMDQAKTAYSNIADQISKENTIINNRLKWILMVNGFMFAAIGFIASDQCYSTKIYEFLIFCIPIAGILINAVGFTGIWGAHLQIFYLTKQWDIFIKLYGGNNEIIFPRPYGEMATHKDENGNIKRIFLRRKSFNYGLVPCFFVPLILILIWFAFILFLTFKGPADASLLNAILRLIVSII